QGRDSSRGGALARGRGSARQGVAQRRVEGGAAAARARACSHLHEAACREDARARLQRDRSGRRLRARRAGPGGCLLQCAGREDRASFGGDGGRRMRLSGIVRFELGYQLRRPWPLLSFAVLLLFALLTTGVAIVPVTLPQDFILNSPFVITSVTVFSCQIWLLLTPMVAGEAAARDVHTGMHPLMYTTPTSRLEYLGGRFLAAFILHALILLAVQIGSLLAVYSPGTNADIVGPFRPAAYLAAYGYIALPNALIATTVQFSAALLTGRPMAAYVGS